MKRLGLIGKPLTHSFSPDYFREKFAREGLTNEWQYDAFEMDEPESELPLLWQRMPELIGLNVTLPYKSSIIPLLPALDDDAKAIGAVNTLVKTSPGEWKGYNTDAPAFEHTIRPMLTARDTDALVLGSGGSVRAISYALRKMGLEVKQVSRYPGKADLTYGQLNWDIMMDHTVIVNCTPAGQFPAISFAPAIPYQHLTHNHLLYDLIYNPAETRFLKSGRGAGARIRNGLDMLKLQADLAFKLWQAAAGV